ncbi:MAG: AsmA family protein [Pseudomonadota bacterium]
MSLFKRPLTLIAAGLSILVAGLAALPFFIPMDVYKSQIESAATDALGRDVVLDGDVSLSILPRISARIDGVQIANPDGFSRPNLLTAGELRGVVRLLPLLSGRVEISEFVFADADLALERLETGAVNWEFASGEDAAEPDGDAGGGTATTPTVDTATLANATVTYADAMTGAAYVVTDLNITATMADLDAPLAVDADGRYQDEPFEIALRVASLGALLNGDATAIDLSADSVEAVLGYDGVLTLGDAIGVSGELSFEADELPRLVALAGIDPGVNLAPLGQVTARGNASGTLDALALSDLSLRISGDDLRAAFDGNLSTAGDGQVSGTIDAASDNLRGFADALGSPLPDGDTLKTFALTSDLAGSFTAIEATNLTAQLDETVATGRAGVDLSGTKPSVTAALTIPRLVLDTFLVASDEPSSSTKPQDSGWSDAAIDLAGLDMVDADIALQSDTVSLGAITLANANLDAVLADGKLTASIDEASVFGGTIGGQIALDGSATTPRASVKLSGSAVDISNTLATLAGLDSLSGIGNVSVDISTAGGTIADMVSGLNGSLGANLADGAVRGFNVAQLVRSRDSLLEAVTDGSLAMALSPEAETDFTAFDTTLRLDNGIGTLSALSFTNPLVLFQGSGTVDLPNQSIDISLIPAIDENAQGQGTRTIAVDGVAIPIRISGSWLSPSIRPDTRLLQESLTASAIDEVTARAADAIGGDAGAILGSVLGGNNSANGDDGAEAAPEQSADEAVESLVRDQLGGLFGRSRDNDPDDE